jgi:glycosyltransferase involved in cell wall biosynthesis
MTTAPAAARQAVGGYASALEMPVGEHAKEPRVVMVHPQGGLHGPARSMLGLAGYLAERRDTVVAVPEGFVARTIRERVPRADLLVLPGGPSQPVRWSRRRSFLMRALSADRHQVLLHANGLSGLNLAAPVARKLDAPVFVHFHASEINARSRAFLQMWKSLGVRMTFFPDSSFSRGLLEATGIRALVGGVLPDPIDRATFAVERGIPHRPFRVGFVGSKSPNKGLHRLIEIARLLREEQVEWHLYGIDLETGRTPYVERCLAVIDSVGLSDRITWGGKVEDTRAAYAGMDVLLLPSDQENIPRVALEAMASGLPVVATRVGSVPEAVWDGVAGGLFDPRNPEEGAERLRRIAADSDLWRELSAGAVRAASRFDVSAVGRLLERFYGDMLHNGIREGS